MKIRLWQCPNLPLFSFKVFLTVTKFFRFIGCYLFNLYGFKFHHFFDECRQSDCHACKKIFLISVGGFWMNFPSNWVSTHFNKLEKLKTIEIERFWAETKFFRIRWNKLSFSIASLIPTSFKCQKMNKKKNAQLKKVS